LLARLAIGLLFSWIALPAFSCSCGERPTVAEVLSTLTVFDGTVISSRPFIERVDGTWYVLEEWTFQVHRAWTRNVAPLVVVRAYPDNCGEWFDVGTRAIVVGVTRDVNGGLGAFRCAYPPVMFDVGNAEAVFGRPSLRIDAPLQTRRLRALRNATSRAVLNVAADTHNWVQRSELPGRGYEAVVGWGVTCCAFVGVLCGVLMRARARVRRRPGSGEP
jgi:hypothetical protein